MEVAGADGRIHLCVAAWVVVIWPDPIRRAREDKRMRADDITVLEAATDGTLAKWWCELNRYDWPSDIADEEPKEHVLNGRRSQIMRWIERKIGMKECLRYWNKDTMPGDEFDRWYDGNMRHG